MRRQGPQTQKCPPGLKTGGHLGLLRQPRPQIVATCARAIPFICALACLYCLLPWRVGNRRLGQRSDALPRRAGARQSAVKARKRKNARRIENRRAFGLLRQPRPQIVVTFARAIPFICGLAYAACFPGVWAIVDLVNALTRSRAARGRGRAPAKPANAKMPAVIETRRAFGLLRQTRPQIVVTCARAIPFICGLACLYCLLPWRVDNRRLGQRPAALLCRAGARLDMRAAGF